MPVIHRYTDNSGYYIKSAFDRNIVTYQVTREGADFLKRQGIGEGSRISVDDLLWLQQVGYVYSGGSGPGEIEPGYASYGRRKGSKKAQQSSCCCAVVTMALAMTAFLGLAVGRRLLQVM